MKRWHLYTPEGVSDTLFEACAAKRGLEAGLRSYFNLAGYREIETPTLEFFDVFGGEMALIEQEQMYKCTDAKGRILVVRPDMTIPVARAAATHFKNPLWPMKCFYIGNTFSADAMGGGRQSEFTQAGIEVLGINSPEADAEVISTAVRAIQATGLADFQIDLGQVDFFRGIMEESGLSAEEIETVRLLIDRKDFVGVEEVVSQHDIPAGLKALLLDLPKLFGSKDIILRLEGLPIGRRAYNALENIRIVLEILEDCKVDKHVSVDLGMVQSLNYYTGIVFRGYAYGVGFPILSGGRYDGLMSRFGLDCPATGFSMNVQLVQLALRDIVQNKKEAAGGTYITYAEGGRKQAALLCDRYRQEGKVAELDIADKEFAEAQEYSRKRGHDVLVRVDSKGVTEQFRLSEGEVKL